jgi:uncharacterized lipoprotein YehR (DUF1307 family)
VKKYFTFVIVFSIVAVFCTGCDQSQEAKNGSVEKKQIENGHKPLPKKNIGGL